MGRPKWHMCPVSKHIVWSPSRVCRRADMFRNLLWMCGILFCVESVSQRRDARVTRTGRRWPGIFEWWQQNEDSFDPVRGLRPYQLREGISKCLSASETVLIADIAPQWTDTPLNPVARVNVSQVLRNHRSVKTFSMLELFYAQVQYSSSLLSQHCAWLKIHLLIATLSDGNLWKAPTFINTWAAGNTPKCP